MGSCAGLFKKNDRLGTTPTARTVVRKYESVNLRFAHKFCSHTGILNQIFKNRKMNAK